MLANRAEHYGWSADGRHLVYTATINLPADATPFVRQALGAAGIIVQAALLIGVLLLGLRGGAVRVGRVALIVGPNGLLGRGLSAQYQRGPGGILARVLGHRLAWPLQAEVGRTRPVR